VAAMTVAGFRILFRARPVGAYDGTAFDVLQAVNPLRDRCNRVKCGSVWTWGFSGGERKMEKEEKGHKACVYQVPDRNRKPAWRRGRVSHWMDMLVVREHDALGLPSGDARRGR